MLDAAQVTRTVSSAVPTPEASVLYADRDPAGPGQVGVAGATIDAETACILAFRDDMPGANWMHPCLYALVEVSTGRLVTTIPAERPPAFGILPGSWIVVSDPGGRADLVRPAPTHDGQDTP